jgi:hypothetical protein
MLVSAAADRSVSLRCCLGHQLRWHMHLPVRRAVLESSEFDSADHSEAMSAHWRTHILLAHSVCAANLVDVLRTFGCRIIGQSEQTRLRGAATAASGRASSASNHSSDWQPGHRIYQRNEMTTFLRRRIQQLLPPHRTCTPEHERRIAIGPGTRFQSAAGRAVRWRRLFPAGETMQRRRNKQMVQGRVFWRDCGRAGGWYRSERSRLVSRNRDRRRRLHRMEVRGGAEEKAAADTFFGPRLASSHAQLAPFAPHTPIP